jgi:hypothetical protein
MAMSPVESERGPPVVDDQDRRLGELELIEERVQITSVLEDSERVGPG